MPPSRARSRICLALVALAALACLAGAGYGLRGPYTYGHFGFHAGEYSTRARHTLRHGAVLPGNVPGATPPAPGTYYIHHPILTHHLVTASFLVLGDHQWSVRLAALAAFLATFCLLALLVWRTLGPEPAAVAALVFAVAPVNAWYATHIDPGFPALACLLGSLLCYVDWLGRGRWRSGLLALLLLGLSEGFEWSPYLVSAFLGAHVLWTAIRRRGRYLAFLPLFVLAAVLPLALHAVAVKLAGQWDDMMGAYRGRTASMAYGPFLRTMLDYCQTLLGWPLLLAIAAGLVLCVGRVVSKRARARDLVFLSLLFATVVYLHIFKVAVVTHAYRLLFAGTLAALALADIHETGARWLRRLPGDLGTVAARLAPPLVVAIVLLATLPTTLNGLAESRAHGGIPGWRVFDPNLPRALFARTLRDRSRLGDRLYLHPSFSFRMDIGYYLDRDFTGDYPLAAAARLPPEARRTALVAFALPPLTADERRLVAELGARHPYLQLGPFGLIDLRSDVPRREVYRLVAPPPAARPWWQRYLDGPYVLPQPVRADPQPPPLPPVTPAPKAGR